MFTAQPCIEHSSAVSWFQAQDVQKQASQQRDVAGAPVLFKALSCKISFIFVFVFMYYLCEKHYKSTTVQDVYLTVLAGYLG